MSIKLKGSSDGSVSFDAPADTSPSGSDITLTLPTSAGSADQFLKNSGIAGELEYSSMIETSTGVGIGGVTSPFDKLQVRTVTDANFVFSSAGGTEASFEIFNNAGSANTPLNYRASEHKFKIQGNEKMRLDSSGRLLLGTTTEGEHTADDLTIATSGDTGISIRSGTSNSGRLFFSDNTSGADEYRGFVSYAHSVNALQFGTDATERMRIGSNGEATLRAATYGMGVRSIAGSSSVNTAYFGAHSSSSISSGTITFEVYTNGNVKNTNNSYGQLSDERLKENIVNAPSQWDDIKSLQVRKYNFRSGNGYDTHTQIGLVAQEVEAVCPGLVQETPVREDATPVLDAEGNELEATKSVLTSVLYMKAVKALQEAQTRIETLESQHADLLARVTALEAA
jgi:hypothetical protein